MRKLVISDIHGCLDEFQKLLALVRYEPADDQLLLLGDYCDRGPDSRGVIEEIMRLSEQGNVIALRGNHEQLMLDALLLEGQDERWIRNGGLQTLASFTGEEPLTEGFAWEDYERQKRNVREAFASHIAFLNELPLYHEDDHFLYVHAGINPAAADWRTQPERDFLWIREAFFQHPTSLDKPVIFGHTPTLRLQETEGVWDGGDKIGIDGGCCFGSRLNGLEIDEAGGWREHFVRKGCADDSDGTVTP
ncbi:serine/threonine protein phosphatase [Paenibacillus sp. J31TS4]|uniref:metallophosphoesterase family protein n=1 Tax=Paenibacillus sp. J31TS4 TaxID=2807195 RepID=UPI001B1A257B|nr:metallophosphoesterase family protein [Paenibacillus sp. J31TS4]GIP40184.1 serine/threonine protein phosphatase [Paenibacillus sp. J31TS4]